MGQSQKYPIFNSLVLLIFLMSAVFACTASSPPSERCQQKGQIAKPHVIVTPDTIQLGVVKLKNTEIIFTGAGFKPGDSVFISLKDVFVPKTGKTQMLPIAAGDVDGSGQFRATVELKTKLEDFMQAELAFNDQFEDVVILRHDPLAAGLYKVVVTSMNHDLQADTRLSIEKAGMLSHFFDWLAEKKGIILPKKQGN